MSTIEPEIKISKEDNKVKSFTFDMPVWTEKSFDGSIKVHIPFMFTMTWAFDGQDVEKAVEESMMGAYVVAEKFGKGMEKELQAIGWILIENSASTSVYRFDVAQADVDIVRTLRKFGSYVNKRIQVV